jgi:hypothetical protein
MGGSCKWTGLTSFTLTRHFNLHCKAYIGLSEAADHVPVQILDEQTRVTNLMDSLDTVDPTVLAAVSLARQDDANKWANFEAAVTFLVQSCPVATKQAKKKVIFNASIATVGVKQGTGLNMPKMGKTGIPLHYHKKADLFKLSQAQKEEVVAWNKANPRKGVKRPHDGSVTEGTRPKKKWDYKLFAISAHQEEVLAAMVESQKAGMEAMASSIASMSPQKNVVASATQAFTDVTVMNKQACVAMLKLQGIMKPPSGTPSTFTAL